MVNYTVLNGVEVECNGCGERPSLSKVSLYHGKGGVVANEPAFFH
eukprot:COSAG02_NODE_1051_length_14956_cov_3.414216_12_plen_45_part_00